METIDPLYLFKPGPMINRLKISTSIALIVSISVFNIGIPIVLYFCPMVESASACCQVPGEGRDGTHTVGRQVHGCCAMFVGAERNTTPYRLAQTFQDFGLKLAAFLESGSSTGQDRFRIERSIDLAPNPSHTRQPLYVLNSSFLI